MWVSPVLLYLGASSVIAVDEDGWKPDMEYSYKFRSRTMTALHPSDDHITGVLIEGTLTVQPKDADNLLAKLTKTQYTQILTKLPGGWDSDIPESEMKFQEFPMTGKPFEIKMKAGVVLDLAVDKNLPTWEINVLKSIVSQLQVDTQGDKKKKMKKKKKLDAEQTSFATYKTMEDSVGGRCEVLYDISPLSMKVPGKETGLVSRPDLIGAGKGLLEIIKTKNYTLCKQKVGYHFGFEGREDYEPGSNNDGRFLSRSSISRIIISGSLDGFTIQSSETVNKVILNPGENSMEQQGMVVGYIHLILSGMNPPTERIVTSEVLESLGTLVYDYDSPLSGLEDKQTVDPDSSLSSEEDKSKADKKRNNEENSLNPSDLDNPTSEDQDYQQPEISLLPYPTVNKGDSYQTDGSVDPVKKSRELAEMIGSELKKPSDIPKEETLEKFTMLTGLIRMMNSAQIGETLKELYDSLNQINTDTESPKRNTWAVYRDALAQAGTGPALVNIKKLIETRKIEGMEASQVVSAAAKSARIPTAEYVDLFYNLTMMPETQEQEFLKESALMSLSNLIRDTIVDKKKARSRYPVYSYMKLSSKSIKIMFKKYIPSMAQELMSALKEKDSRKAQIYIKALGKIAHPKILGVFEPFIEKRLLISKYQRLLMVASLFDMAKIYPKVARSVSYKIYANTDESHEIRCMAVMVLMRTKPPAGMLQRMAEFTNYDESKHVKSVVKSSIESASKLKGLQDQDLALRAQAARGLLTPENFGPQYSRNIIRDLHDEMIKMRIQASYISGKDSLIPKAFYLFLQRGHGGFQMSENELTGMVSSVEDVLSLLDELMNEGQDSGVDESTKAATLVGSNRSPYSADKLGKILGIKVDESQPIEGLVEVNSQILSQMIPFDRKTLERIPETLKQATETLNESNYVNLNKLTSEDRSLSFPMETGLPFTYSLRTPMLLKVEGNVKVHSEPKLSEMKKIPDKLEVNSEMRTVISKKIQERIGFMAIFEHRHYITGNDKNTQIDLPARLNANYDRLEKKFRMEIEPSQKSEPVKLLQTNHVPYMAKHDIIGMNPVLKDPENTHIIEEKTTTFKINSDMFGDDINMELEVGEHEKESDEEKMLPRDPLSPFTSTLSKLKRTYSKMSVEAIPNPASAIKMTLSYNSKRKSASDSENGMSEESSNGPIRAEAPHPTDREPNSKSREEEFLRDVSKGMSTAKAEVVDITLEKNGRQNFSLSITCAVARSSSDQRTRSFLYMNTKQDNEKKYEVCAAMEMKKPLSPELDYKKLLRSDLTTEMDAEIQLGKDCETGGKIKIHGKMQQSEEHKDMVQESPEAKELEREMSGKGGEEMYEESKMLKARKTLLDRASKLDEAEMTVEFDDNASAAKEASMKLLEIAGRKLADVSDMKTMSPRNAKENKIDLKMKKTAKRGADISVYSPNMDMTMKNMKLYDFAGMSKNYQEEDCNDEMNLGLHESGSTCLMHRSSLLTFDNHVYPQELGNCWHVVMTTYSKGSSEKSSNKGKPKMSKDKKTTILARETMDGKKEVKIILGQKEINLKKPGVSIEVSVDGVRVPISETKESSLDYDMRMKRDLENKKSSKGKKDSKNKKSSLESERLSESEEDSESEKNLKSKKYLEYKKSSKSKKDPGSEEDLEKKKDPKNKKYLKSKKDSKSEEDMEDKEESKSKKDLEKKKDSKSKKVLNDDEDSESMKELKNKKDSKNKKVLDDDEDLESMKKSKNKKDLKSKKMLYDDDDDLESMKSLMSAKDSETDTVEIFKLDDGSIKVISESNQIEVVYDGYRLKIKASEKYRSKVRGLCGDYDGESSNDQKTPKNCMLKDPREFAATWALIDEKCEGPAKENAERAKESKCVEEEPRPYDVISDEDTMGGESSVRKRSSVDDPEETPSCNIHRVMVIRGENDTCFSLRPLPVCLANCKPLFMKPKFVEMHCVANSIATEKLAERIEIGANPDLSEKTVTKMMRVDLPIACSPAVFV